MSGILTDVTTKRWMERAEQLATHVGDLAMKSKSIEVTSKENLVVRGILPAQDFNTGDENGWGGSTEYWVQDFNASGTDDSYNEAYQIDSNNAAEDKIIGLMGITFLHSDVQTRQIRFGSGTTGTQGVRREFNLESAETDEEGRALFLTDLIYDAKEDGNIEEYTETAADGGRTVYHGFVAEPVGETISEYSSPHAARNGGMTGGRGR